VTWPVGQRVALAGRVESERSGFVTVRWDDGSRSIVWGPDLERRDDREPPERV
jgi:hypothetical protein